MRKTMTSLSVVVPILVVFSSAAMSGCASSSKPIRTFDPSVQTRFDSTALDARPIACETEIATTGEPAITAAELDEPQILRSPPVIPAQAFRMNISGKCKTQFNIASDGSVQNVVVFACTNDVFKNATRNVVYKWKYNFQGSARAGVAQCGVEAAVIYQIQDENGVLLPY